MTSMQDVLPLVPRDEWIPAQAITRILGHGALQALGDLYAKRLIDRRPVGRDRRNLWEYRKAGA